MSKISLEVPFTAFKGKICKHTNIIYKQLRDTQFTSQICHPRTKPYSEEEISRQNKFKTAAAAAKAIMADPTQRATAEADFNAQTKYKTLYGFLLASEYAKLS